jgi:hypothetical protein
MSLEQREILDRAAERAGTSTGAYMLESSLERAVQGALVIPPEVAHLIRQEAEVRGIDEVTLAALVAQQAVLLARPRPMREEVIRLICQPGAMCSLHAQGGDESTACPGYCDEHGCRRPGQVELRDGRRVCIAHAPSD